MGTKMLTILLILSGEDHKSMIQQLMIQKNKDLTPQPIYSKQQYKSATLKNKRQKQCFTSGTLGEDKLKSQLLKECMKTSHLQQMAQQLQNKAQKKEKKAAPLPTNPRKERARSPSVSPGTVRKKYLPRITRPPAAHQPAAAAPGAAQAQHLQAPNQLKNETKPSTTTHRHPRLTPFKQGFEWETEQQLSQAFRRPPRLFKEDKPFYPWLPKYTPLVNFHLNFKG